MVLQTLLDERYIVLASGERVQCADGVVFVAGDNTFGFGDETGVYAGTMSSNAALVDRFAVMVRVDYLPAGIEAEALANRSGAPRAACDRVVAFIGGARKLPGFDARPLSLRRMVAFVETSLDGFGANVAFENTMLTRLPDAERQALHVHFRSNFEVAKFESELTGVPIVPQSDAPNQNAARVAFDEVNTME
jgi:MoxR-like ATPase